MGGGEGKGWQGLVAFLSWKDPLHEIMATHSSTLAWRIPMDRGAMQAAVHEVTESDMTEQLSTQYIKARH